MFVATFIMISFMLIGKYVPESVDVTINIITYYVLLPMIYWTPGTKTFALFREKNSEYISASIALIGFVLCLSWVLSDFATFNVSAKGILYLIIDIFTLSLCLLQIIFKFKYKKKNDMENAILIGDDTIESGGQPLDGNLSLLI